MTQQASFRTDLHVENEKIQVDVTGKRAVFWNTTGSEILSTENLHTGVQKWLNSIGNGGTAKIEGPTVVAEIPGHTFTEEEIDQAKTHLATALTHRKGMGAQGKG